MVGLNLLTEARSVGLTVEAVGDRLVVRGPKSAAETAKRLLLHKAEVIAAIAVASRRDTRPAFDWDWFDFISDDDRRFLLGPRDYPPCPWCGGRFLHSTPCNELHAAWAIKMSFGKHKGTPVCDVPTDYLKWARKKAQSLRIELSEEINRVLEARERNEGQRTATFIEVPPRSAWWVCDNTACADLPNFAAACPVCGSLADWWNYLGEPHCQKCRPLDESNRRRQDAIDLRRRADIQQQGGET